MNYYVVIIRKEPSLEMQGISDTGKFVFIKAFDGKLKVKEHERASSLYFSDPVLEEDIGEISLESIARLIRHKLFTNLIIVGGL